MVNIIDRQQEERKLSLFRLAFRPFFLFASLFSILALSLWAIFLYNPTSMWQPLGGWYWWHGHEMLFGFVSAIIVGFLLTAVQNWSGIPGLSGWPLALLFIIWLAGRLLVLFPVIPKIAIAVLDTSFLPIAAITLSYPIIRTKLWRNLAFVPLLLLMAWTNGHAHYRLMQGEAFSLPDTQGTILLITLIIIVMGGRVIPFFTTNALGLKKPQPIVVIELLAIVPLLLVTLYSLITQNLQPQPHQGFLLLISVVANAIRIGRWKSELTLKNPLLWSLHLAYLFIILSLSLLTLYHFKLSIPLTSSLHGLTVGGMGLMILAMISRVSLGHTGRTLNVGTGMILGYIALIIATVMRVIPPLITSQLTPWYILSALCWLFAYVAFVWIYWPVLTRPRADGKPG
ncbi:MAG: NnrS family protein [Porticoccus sp.]|nr:NnrS family protein [Porticoccus sp.]